MFENMCYNVRTDNMNNRNWSTAYYKPKLYLYNEHPLKLDYSVSKVKNNLNFFLKLCRDDELRELSGKLPCFSCSVADKLLGMRCCM